LTLREKSGISREQALTISLSYFAFIRVTRFPTVCKWKKWSRLNFERADLSEFNPSDYSVDHLAPLMATQLYAFAALHHRVSIWKQRVFVESTEFNDSVDLKTARFIE